MALVLPPAFHHTTHLSQHPPPPHTNTQLVDLLEFARLNSEGFRKICKKFDKEHKGNTREQFMSSKVSNSHMMMGKVCEGVGIRGWAVGSCVSHVSLQGAIVGNT